MGKVCWKTALSRGTISFFLSQMGNGLIRIPVFQGHILIPLIAASACFPHRKHHTNGINVTGLP